MKIKKEFYCIVDNNNRPDFRFLFENLSDAKIKIKKIKNSIQGETFFVSSKKRIFFDKKINRKLISKNKRIAIRPGCWTSLAVKKVNLTEDIQPEYVFKNKINSQYNFAAFSFEKKPKKAIPFIQKTEIFLEKIKKPVQNDFSFSNFWSFSLKNSFIKSYFFQTTILGVFLIVFGLSYFYTQQFNSQIIIPLENNQNQSMKTIIQNQVKVLGERTSVKNTEFEENFDDFILKILLAFNQLQQEELEKEIRTIVANSPMEKMAPLIAKQDRKVAAFLVGIAKKESNFGRRVPILNGQDCFNYWGYRGIRPRMGTDGHTCFDSPEDAVYTVAKRIKELVKTDINTPSEMVIWKCGSSCEQHSMESVRKWISDVNIYYQKIMESKTDNSFDSSNG